MYDIQEVQCFTFKLKVSIKVITAKVAGNLINYDILLFGNKIRTYLSTTQTKETVRRQSNFSETHTAHNHILIHT